VDTNLKCEDVVREVSNFVDDELDPVLRGRMEAHFTACTRCKSVLAGVRNISSIARDTQSFPLPAGFSARLRRRIEDHLQATKVSEPQEQSELSLGIVPSRVPPGSHLIYFWETDDEFARGVRFLELGLRENQHCIAFGHDEALEKITQVLRSGGFDVERLLQDRKLSILRRDSTVVVTLSKISAIFHNALAMGAPAIRFLGNLGIGRDPLPGGEDDVLELESRVTATAARFPSVVVCMYDVKTLSGRIVMKGGFQTHPLSICGDAVQQNPYFIPEQDFLPRLRHTK
jgi:hypothetical protein